MSLDEPNKKYPKSEGSLESFMPGFIPDPSIKGDSFNELINNRGIRFKHKIAAPCPNMNKLYDNNHDPECPFCDQSQILYIEEREIWGTFSNNTLEKLYEIQGVWEVGTAVITFPTEYDDGTQADFNVFDQLECPDFQIRLSDLREYDGTGKTRVKYPIVKPMNITAISNGSLKTYKDGEDFDIVDGDIVWRSGKEPSYDNITEVGEVMSITYAANPVYNVLQNLHELRVTQEYQNGEKTAKRLPQQVMVRRDFLFTPDSGSQ